MIYRSLVIIVLVAGTAQAQAPRPAQPGAVQRLAWMSGCWQRLSEGGARVVDEQWMAPRGAMMLGMSRTMRGDSVVEYEQLRLFQRAGQAVYRASPSGQPAAEFVAATVTDSSVTFENLAHDFPQRIVYRARGVDSLLARIEGTVGGRARSVDFPYARVSCGPAPAKAAPPR